LSEKGHRWGWAYIEIVVYRYDFNESVDDVLLVVRGWYIREPLHVLVNRVVIDAERGHRIGPRRQVIVVEVLVIFAGGDRVIRRFVFVTDEFQWIYVRDEFPRFFFHQISDVICTVLERTQQIIEHFSTRSGTNTVRLTIYKHNINLNCGKMWQIQLKLIVVVV
jgi:hypothetical protein